MLCYCSGYAWLVSLNQLAITVFELEGARYLVCLGAAREMTTALQHDTDRFKSILAGEVRECLFGVPVCSTVLAERPGNTKQIW